MLKILLKFLRTDKLYRTTIVAYKIYKVNAPYAGL